MVEMTAGEMEFSVYDGTDWIQCPDSNGVGTSGQGGVFNCGLTGTKFRIKCTMLCSPNLSLVEVVIWTENVVSIGGSHYYLNGGYTDWVSTTVQQLFETGSSGWYIDSPG